MIRKAIIIALLLLALATIGVGIASYYQPIHLVDWSLRGESYSFSSVNGRFWVKRNGMIPFYDPGPHPSWVWEDYGAFGMTIRFPGWLPVLLLALLLATFLLGPLRRDRRRKRNQCIHCGYNLTGNESGACPECGETA